MKVSVKIKAGASKSEIVDFKNNILKLRIKAPAQDGKANKELIRFLAKFLKVTQKEIEILNGHTNPSKIISLPDSAESILNQLKSLG